MLSKSWIKLIHRSVVERKLGAENDKEVLASVIWRIEIGFWSPPSDSVDLKIFLSDFYALSEVKARAKIFFFLCLIKAYLLWWQFSLHQDIKSYNKP